MVAQSYEAAFPRASVRSCFEPCGPFTSATHKPAGPPVWHLVNVSGEFLRG